MTFQLVKADDEEQTPVAEFHPHKRHFFVFRMSQHAFFEIKPDPQVAAALEKLIGESCVYLCLMFVLTRAQ